MAKKEFEIIISRLDQAKSYHYRLNSWQFYLVLGVLVGIFILGILSIFLIGYINQNHLLVNYLAQRNQELEHENQKVKELAERLNYLEAERAKIALMLGADKNPPPLDLNKLAEISQPLPKVEVQDTTVQWVLPTTNFIITRSVSKDHEGVDFATQLGMPVYAVASGYVEDVGYDSFYGNYLKLRVEERFHAFYGHLYRSLKGKNEPVKSGEIIGYVGSSGKSTAPHLHFELWEVTEKGERRLDPEVVFKDQLKAQGKNPQ
jgi:murein DD-endopeptidase MepM/ murein hydrolase activator NlpD